MLCRLADILPPPLPAAPEPPPPPPVVADPSASAHVERVLRAMVEILGGRRPARQLSAVLRPDVLGYLVELQAVAGALQPQVRKVFARHQGAGALEAVALVSLRTGVRAMAARFEEQPDSRWRCTALQLRFTAGDLAAHRSPVTTTRGGRTRRL
ncbi:MAG: Rv3235 family protein [Pseudonocardiaceae bacterium]